MHTKRMILILINDADAEHMSLCEQSTMNVSISVGYI